jgi:uncharacterized membrane protein
MLRSIVGYVLIWIGCAMLVPSKWIYDSYGIWWTVCVVCTSILFLFISVWMESCRMEDLFRGCEADLF